MTTKNIVPRATGEGSLGTATKKWGNIYADYITLEDGETLQTKIANQNSRITTAEGTVSTLSGDVTSLYGSVEELSDGKANKSTTYTKTETDTELAKKLNLSGGEIGTDNTFAPLTLNRTGDGYSAIKFKNSNGVLGYFGANNIDNGVAFISADTNNIYAIPHIMSSGTNHIRYSSGLQICWGVATIAANANEVSVSFQQPFKDYSSYGVSASTNYSASYITCYNQSTNGFKALRGVTQSVSWEVRWIAIGRWK